MKVGNQSYRTIWINDEDVLCVINQLVLPHTFEISSLKDIDAVCDAIRNMVVRGAGLIGATAAYGIWVAAKQAPKQNLEAFNAYMQAQAERLLATRPTASNLAWAIHNQLTHLKLGATIDEKIALAALERLDNLYALLTSIDVEQFPSMWAVIPKVSSRLCNYCPYFQPFSKDESVACSGDTL